jgi:hypothetical protein
MSESHRPTEGHAIVSLLKRACSTELNYTCIVSTREVKENASKSTINSNIKNISSFPSLAPSYVRHKTAPLFSQRIYLKKLRKFNRLCVAAYQCKPLERDKVLKTLTLFRLLRQLFALLL